MTCLYWWHMLWFPSQRSLVVALNQAVSLSINKFMSRKWDSCKTLQIYIKQRHNHYFFNDHCFSKTLQWNDSFNLFWQFSKRHFSKSCNAYSKRNLSTLHPLVHVHLWTYPNLLHSSSSLSSQSVQVLLAFLTPQLHIQLTISNLLCFSHLYYSYA